MHELTKSKFQSFTSEQQHKKCAEVLRIAYEELLQGRSAQKQLDTYQQLALWLEMQTIEDEELKFISDRYHHHLQKALLKHKEHNLLPNVRSKDREQSEPIWPIAIYFDNIRSAHNVGSMLRTIEAFALGKAFFSEATPGIENKQVNDAAMGTCSWIKCETRIPLECLPKPIIALETSPAGISLFEFIFPETFTLVVGNEEYGCSNHSLSKADTIMEIPMRGRKNSLNVANAFAIAAAEIYRQRKIS